MPITKLHDETEALAELRGLLAGALKYHHQYGVKHKNATEKEKRVWEDALSGTPIPHTRDNLALFTEMYSVVALRYAPWRTEDTLRTMVARFFEMSDADRAQWGFPAVTAPAPGVAIPIETLEPDTPEVAAAKRNNWLRLSKINNEDITGEEKADMVLECVRRGVVLQLVAARIDGHPKYANEEWFAVYGGVGSEYICYIEWQWPKLALQLAYIQDDNGKFVIEVPRG